MAINFPNSPAPNDLYTYNGITWRWDGQSWISLGSSVAGISGPYVISLSGLTGVVGLCSGSNINIVPSGNNLVISSTASGGGISGPYVISLRGLTGIIGLSAGTNITISQSGNTLILSSSGGGATGATGPQGNTGATGPVGDYVISIRGLTGAVGITNGSGIGLSVSGQTLTFSNTGVLSIDGGTGAITNVARTDVTNTFSAYQIFTGISSAGATISGPLVGTTGFLFGDPNGSTFIRFVPALPNENGGLHLRNGIFQIGQGSIAPASGFLNVNPDAERMTFQGRTDFFVNQPYQTNTVPLSIMIGLTHSVDALRIGKANTPPFTTVSNIVAGCNNNGVWYGLGFCGGASGSTFVGLVTANSGISASGGITLNGTFNSTGNINSAGNIIGTSSTSAIEAGFNGWFRGPQWLDPFGQRIRTVYNWSGGGTYSIDFRVSGFCGTDETTRFNISAVGVSGTTAFFNGLLNANAGISASGGSFANLISVNRATLGVTNLTNYLFGVNAGGLLTSGTKNILIGTSAGLGFTNQSDNIAIGDRALQGSTGSGSVAIGTNALLNSSQSNSVAIGNGALQNNTGLVYAVAVGSGALQNNSANTVLAVGFNALSNNAGNGNMAVGPFAMANNTNASATNNCAMGTNALFQNSGTRNTAVGNDTLVGGAAYVGQSGSRNAVIGFNAGFSNTSGSDNVFIGNQAGFGNSSGSNNVFIGSVASGSTSGTTTREIVIGSNAVGLGSNTAVIGATTQTSATIYGVLNSPSGISASGLTLSGSFSGTTASFTGLITFTAGMSGNGITLSGNLSASTKSFVIPHPTKPGKTLQYGSLEGPENGVYVRGKIEDSNIIQLPEYWTGLVDESTITAQLTEYTYKDHHWIVGIENNSVIINSESGKIHCYYNVYGERKDVAKLRVEY